MGVLSLFLLLLVVVLLLKHLNPNRYQEIMTAYKNNNQIVTTTLNKVSNSFSK